MCQRESRGRDRIRGSIIDMGIQASYRNTAAKLEAADDPQIFFSNPLFVKLPGHWGIRRSTPLPILGFNIAFTPLERWQGQGGGVKEIL